MEYNKSGNLESGNRGSVLYSNAMPGLHFCDQKSLDEAFAVNKHYGNLDRSGSDLLAGP